MNYNVRLSLWWTVVENVSGSIRAGDALSAYLFLLTKKNSVVGFVQGINGILQLVVALPAGWLADRTRRDLVLRIGAVVGLAGGIALAWAITFTHSATAIAIAMALLGCYRGFYNPALEALFADSVASGRSGPYTWRYVAMVMSSGVGPLLSLLIFLHLGDSWTLADCRTVVHVGLVAMVPALCLMWFFNDDKALSHHHQNGNTDPPAGENSNRTGISSSSHESDLIREPLLGDSNVNGSDGDVATGGSLLSHRSESGGEGEGNLMAEESGDGSGSGIAVNNIKKENSSTADSTDGMWSPTIVVPVLLTLSDIFGALASGMTIKFFPLFFMQRTGLSPAFVSLISAASPMGIAGASVLAQRGSKRLGRVQLSMVTRLVDVLFLVAMAFLPTTAGTARNLLIAVHLVRMAAANCTRPLMRSVLNQFVPREHRAKVNAVDSVRTFSWSGSAALGGILVERLGFEGTFLVTAAIKLGSFLPLLFLVRYMPDGVWAGGRGEAAIAAVAAVPTVRAEEQGVMGNGVGNHATNSRDVV